MSTPFEIFVQTELPKRPYLDTDVAAESVIVRRGVGPRQLSAVPLTEGQVLGMSGGVLVGLSQTAINYTVTTFATAATTWTITHGKNNKNVILTLRDGSDHAVEADDIQYNANSIVVTFAVAQAGTAVAVYLG